MPTLWTRKRTFEPEHEDWTVLRDGLVVGRVLWDVTQHPRRAAVWRWAVITVPSRTGYVETMAAALAQVKAQAQATDRWAPPLTAGPETHNPDAIRHPALIRRIKPVTIWTAAAG